ncbi:MAG: alpha/beta fold hydrolase [Verrucomicrobiota bacterium]
MKKVRLIGMIALICLTLIGVGRACSPSAPPREAQRSVSAETVVLLHGLARSSKAMNKMEKELRAEGYRVINHDYPSTKAPVEKLTKQVFKTLEPQIKEAEAVHFVTHSMGGIILRQHLEEHEIPNLGRVVMLAPPSRGSEVTDKLGSIFLYKWINGPAGNQLGTGTNSHPLRLKAPEFELGIIAGDRTINPFLSMLIPGPDDGKVSLARVKTETYTDYLQLHVTHPCMVWNKVVISQTKHFLKYGQFHRAGKDWSLRSQSPAIRTADILSATEEKTND